MRVRKTREVRPDGAHAYTWTYQAKIADALAAQRDREREAQAAQDAVLAAEKAQAEKAAAEGAAEARRRACLAPRPCLICRALLPPEAFEPHYRAYNGRMGACRPCAQLIRDRKTAPVGRRPRLLSPRPCRGCGGQFAPPHGKQVYCTDECRRNRQKEQANARRRENRAADPEPERQYRQRYRAKNGEKCRQQRRKYWAGHKKEEAAAHASWVLQNRERVNAYMREFQQRRAALREAKQAFQDAGDFLLIRARSGFWRGAAAGEAIGRTETIMARFEWDAEAWRVRPPAVATEAVRQACARLRQGEERRPAKKPVPEKKAAPVTHALF